MGATEIIPTEPAVDTLDACCHAHGLDTETLPDRPRAKPPHGSGGVSTSSDGPCRTVSR